MEKTSVLDQLKALDEERAKLLDGAKAEALKQAEKAIAQLNKKGPTDGWYRGGQAGASSRRSLSRPRSCRKGALRRLNDNLKVLSGRR